MRKLRLRPEIRPDMAGLLPEQAVDAVLDTAERADAMRRAVHRQRGPIGFRIDPMLHRVSWGMGNRWVPALMSLASLCGLALVHDRRQATQVHVLGRECNHEAWDIWAKPFLLSLKDPSSVPLRAYLLRCLEIDRAEIRVPPERRSAREDRISLLYLKHFVAEHWPELRADEEEGTEIELRPRHGGLRLGGVVMPIEHYRAGLHEKGLLKATPLG